MISVVLLFCVLFFLGAALPVPALTIETYFDGSISGLEVGAPVKSVPPGR